MRRWWKDEKKIDYFSRQSSSSIKRRDMKPQVGIENELIFQDYNRLNNTANQESKDFELERSWKQI